MKGNTWTGTWNNEAPQRANEGGTEDGTYSAEGSSQEDVQDGAVPHNHHTIARDSIAGNGKETAQAEEEEHATQNGHGRCTRV